MINIEAIPVVDLQMIIIIAVILLIIVVSTAWVQLNSRIAKIELPIEEIDPPTGRIVNQRVQARVIPSRNNPRDRRVVYSGRAL